MKTKLILGTTSLLVMLSACLTLKRVNLDNYQIRLTPPNGVRISDQLFCDQTEISNFFWLEYMWWNERIFGRDSPEYLATCPGGSVSQMVDDCHAVCDMSYLNMAYQNHPVIGVTQAQAEAFSKWRSDRVFELVLVRLGAISYLYPERGNTDYFTTAKYFNGELTQVISDHKVYYYPEFRLPNLDERQWILAYADSVNQVYIDHCKSKSCRSCAELWPEIWSDFEPNQADILDVYPTREVEVNCFSKGGKLIYNLRGNVAEWTSLKNVTVGGGWRDSKVQILASDTNTTIGQNAWTGFRNVCEWKRRSE